MSTSRGGCTELTSSANRTSSSVVLPMALTTTTTSLPGPTGPGDVVGHGTDAVGVADRGPAELLHHAATWGQGYRRTPGPNAVEQAGARRPFGPVVDRLP